MTTPNFDLSPTEKTTLLSIAAASIHHGLNHHNPLPIVFEQYPPALLLHRSAFVTLTIDGNLQGCIGSLEAQRALAKEIAENAFGAAFRDSRFSPLTDKQYPLLQIEISILSNAVPITFDSEANLLAQLRPNEDGLILEANHHRRGTFLPTVWESLPTPADFFNHLKQKTGLSTSDWSNDWRILRYTTLTFKQPISAIMELPAL